MPTCPNCADIEMIQTRGIDRTCPTCGYAE